MTKNKLFLGDENIISDEEFRKNIIEIDIWIKDMKNFIFTVNEVIKKSDHLCNKYKSKKYLDF